MEQEIADLIIKTFKRGNTLFTFGNGGSAELANHMAGEFVGKYLYKRRALPALSLCNNSSILTSIPNDDSFFSVFSRQLEALAKKEDMAIGFSTSGNSLNVNLALAKGDKLGLTVIDFPRKGNSTPEIQEYQLHLMHEVCRIVEESFL